MRIVAFLDVLGFSEIVLNSDKKLIEEYFTYLKNSLVEISESNNVEYYYISDSIIVTALDSFENFNRVLKCVRVIQSQLLSRKILLRGGITVGELCINKKENIIVGPGLVNAYRLENMAKLPRVIIDRKVIKHYALISTSDFLRKVNYSELKKTAVHSTVAVDTDQFMYVNYLSLMFTRRQNFNNKIIEGLFNHIQKSFYENFHLEKYSWLKEKIIAIFEEQLALSATIQPIGKGSRSQKNVFQKQIPGWIKHFREI